MAVTVVAGTPLQAAIDKAQPGDTLDVKAGGYAGRLKIAKALTLQLAPDAVVDGGQGDGFINVDISAANVTWKGGVVQHSGCAFRFAGKNLNALVEDVSIPIVDWMYRNTAGGSDDWGGNAFTGKDASGITIRRVKASKLRAVSLDYTRDGGFIDLFQMADVLVDSCEMWDSVNFAESGRSSGGPLNTNIRFQNNIVHGRPNVSVGASNTTVANGMYLRAMTGLVIKGNTFDRIDWWTVLFATAGGFGGPIDGEVTDNTFVLLPGVNRMTTWDTTFDPKRVIFNNNRVYADDPNSVVAEGGGKRYLRGDKALLTTATGGWEANSFWGPTPPPQPVDPCAPYKLRITDLQSQLATVVGQLEAANTALSAQTQTIAGQDQTLANIHALSAP